MALRRRLPLDHDGLVGAAAGDDVLWRSAGRLLWEGDAGNTPQKGSESDFKAFERSPVLGGERERAKLWWGRGCGGGGASRAHAQKA